MGLYQKEDHIRGRISTPSSWTANQHSPSPSHHPCSIYRQQAQRSSLSEVVEEERGESPQVEMKLHPESQEDLNFGLSSDIIALFFQHSGNRRKAVFYLTLISLLIFTIAFLLGYVAFRGSCQYCGDTNRGLVPVDDTAGYDYSSHGSVMYLGELKDMLRKYLKEEQIESTVRRVSRSPHPPGSSEGSALASEILQKFRQLHMDHTWTDSHYATLQFPSRTQRNSLWIVDANDEVVEEIPLGSPMDYCAYSATGTATGGVVYVNYGRQEDFDLLRSLGVSMGGAVAVVRVGGGVSFAEKVWHAQRAGLGGVLIYPDPADVPQDPRRLGLYSSAAISEHVGDPFTPGFPSFNHTQFPPTQSSGLPVIPAQPISANVASKLLSQLTGPGCPRGWQGRLPYVRCALGPGLSSGEGRRVRMGVYNTMRPVLLNNIFASIEGKIEPDQYIIMGAQRDSWGPGAAKAGVGTAILLELARTFSTMVENGDDILSAYTSPLLVDLIEGVIKQVEHPKHSGRTIFSHAESMGSNWKSQIVKPLYLNSGAYSFTAFGGVPAMELRFTEDSRPYPFVNTQFDTADKLQEMLQGRLGALGRSLGELVGLMVLRLAHDNILPLDVTCYSGTALHFSSQLNKYSSELQWVFSARGDYNRAAETLREAILNSDIQDERMTRLYNTRIMRVEYYFLSQYVSAVETPFRHVLHGRGEHTLSALTEHLSLLRSNPHLFDEARFRRQLALLTWTLQGAANALSGDVWNIDNTF
ncbi:hypothetical protein JZ751_006741 [Albula glossodonta]|uniref:PA domain-containing protein n=1 Tax=Albula glossodonta TaxID=121402 RepID=A0A8T2P3Q8_9TELE|nr:hypothetical protein JZ751_006741 [Albula glossodonta]